MTQEREKDKKKGGGGGDRWKRREEHYVQNSLVSSKEIITENSIMPKNLNRFMKMMIKDIQDFFVVFSTTLKYVT